jgi:hypothetical protein
MKIIKCAPNGDCLFIALYVGYELICRKREQTSQSISGTDDLALKRGSLLKRLIKEFYAKDHWDKETKFGTRKSILQTELSSVRDTTDDDIEAYLQTLSWGSTPEYLAFALLSNVSIKVYVPRENTLVLRDSVDNGPDTISLVYANHHYDVLHEDLS